jgi:trk system potassium uptake protein TrkA
MKKQFAVIGLGRFGYSIAKTLTELGCEVIAVDKDEERVKKISEFVEQALQLEAMDEKSLKSIGIQDVDVAIVSIGEDIEASTLVVMILKEMGIKHIIAKAVTRLHGKVLENLGVTRVVYPEKEMAIKVAHTLIKPNIIEQLDLSQEYSIVELPAPEKFVNKTLNDIQLRTKHGVNLIATKRKVIENNEKKEVWNVNPMADDVIQKDDILVLIGSNEALDKLS